jgi:membrane-associated phospholipid phosphatase
MAVFSQEVYEWGLSAIRALQNASSPVLDEIVKAVTHIGSPSAAIAIILFAYWCVDSKKGFRLFFLTFAVFALNVCLKNIFRVPRPFVLDPSVGLIAEKGFSTPSGHAQGTAAFWTLFAGIFLTRRKKTGIALAVCVPIAVSFTRVYLGVHYPTDVLLGLAIGYLCALGGILFYDSAAKKIAPQKTSVKALLVALACLAANRFSGEDVTASAALFGFTLGYILIAPNGIPRAENTRTKIIGCVLSGILCFLTYTVLKLVSRALAFPPAYNSLVVFVRYAALGFAASFAAPKLRAAVERRPPGKH